MINVVVLQGRLCFDVKVKDGKTPYMQNRLAVRNGSDDKDTVFIDIKIFGKQAEVVDEYCKKGDMIGVSGRLTQYTNDDDETFLSVVANSVEIFWNGKKDDDDDDDEKPKKKNKKSRSRDDDDDEDEDRPKKKSRRKSRKRYDDDDDDEEDY